MKFLIYRYNPETDSEPRMQEHVLAQIRPDMMLRDALIEIKARDESLSFRHSCGEGVCGSDALNINGLACITPLANASPQKCVHFVPCDALGVETRRLEPLYPRASSPR